MLKSSVFPTITMLAHFIGFFGGFENQLEKKIMWLLSIYLSPTCSLVAPLK